MGFTNLISITNKAMEDHLMDFLYDVVKLTIKGKEDIWWKEVVEDKDLNLLQYGTPVFTLDHVDLEAMDIQCMLKFLKFDNNKKRTVNANNLLANGTLTSNQLRDFTGFLVPLMGLRNKIVAHQSVSVKKAYDVFSLEKDLAIIKYAMQPFREVEGFSKHYDGMCEFYEKYKNYSVEENNQRQKVDKIKKYIAGGAVLILLAGVSLWFMNGNKDNKGTITGSTASTSMPSVADTPEKTTEPTKEVGNNQAVKDVTTHNGKVKVSLLALRKGEFELKLENNTEIEVSLFDLPQVILADGEAVTLEPFAGDNFDAKKDSVPAGSHKVYKLTYGKADPKEIKRITGKLFSLDSSVKDKNYSIELRID